MFYQKLTTFSTTNLRLPWLIPVTILWYWIEPWCYNRNVKLMLKMSVNWLFRVLLQEHQQKFNTAILFNSGWGWGVICFQSETCSLRFCLMIISYLIISCFVGARIYFFPVLGFFGKLRVKCYGFITLAMQHCLVLKPGGGWKTRMLITLGLLVMDALFISLRCSGC